ncbi:MAG: inorganic diphosphatase [Bacteroidota bacterium]|nr:inorganic diphosphatase [Bacteroidota bacterium]
MKLPKTYTEDKQAVNVVIETPYKSRNKYAYDKDTGLYKLRKVLPAGLAFPCDMGFIPNTKGGDGDPLDVLILMDELTFPGCVVESRLIGIIKATQKEKGKKAERNDRIIGVPVEMEDSTHIKDISDVSKNKIDAIISFFEYYNAMADKKFKLIEIAGYKSIDKMLKDAMK